MYKLINHKYWANAIIALFVFLLCSCEKYLDVKPDKSLLVISTYADLQALLDNYNRNKHMLTQEVFADNYYLAPETWASFTNPTDRNSYIWENDEVDEIGWSLFYAHIYNVNVVLDELPKIKPENAVVKNNLEGTALFMRAYSFYDLLQIFAKPYDKQMASHDLGIPLRLSPDINIVYSRASLEESYQQVINDYKNAIRLLPEHTNYPTRPNKAAAYAALARTYLTMENYEQAALYADSSLLSKNKLLDYNSLNLTQTNPISLFNVEVLFHTSNLAIPLLPANLRVSPDLYEEYKQGDLRKLAFFVNNVKGFYGFRGSYNQSNSTLFAGIAVDEVYLIRAEASLRIGNRNLALADLNFLLKHRWDKNSFEPLSLVNDKELLKVILQERRKELVFRGVRWTDLRRLNRYPEFAKSIERNVNGKQFSLAPNSSKYTALIPIIAIKYGGIEQNVR